MFHLQTLELLHWDYCRRVSMPLDGSIITIAGPNGSGKTTLLDALRTLLGLECSGGRTYKTYARHANAETAWLKATVDNRPRSRQNSDRPFAKASLLYADQVTLACRIERQGGDWQRRYMMCDGVVEIEQLAERGEREWLGIEAWKKRLEAAGLTRAIGRVLALEQGQTDRLCELSPRELLRLVFEVFGDQEVLDRYEQARSHQQQLEKDVAQSEHELAHSRTQLAELGLRVNSYQQHQQRLRERERLGTEVLPVMQWAEARSRTVQDLRELHRQRLFAAADARALSDKRAALHGLFETAESARKRLKDLDAQRPEARQAFHDARDAEKPVEELVKREEQLKSLAAVESDAQQLTALTEDLAGRRHALSQDYTRVSDNQRKAQSALDALAGQKLPPPPPEVTRFRRALEEAGIAHHALADCIDIADESWRAAAEGLLRPSRWVLVLARAQDESRAYALASKERYRHYIVAEGEAVANAPKGSLLAALKCTAKLPTWLARQLAGVQCVADTEAGTRTGGEWITQDAYYRDGRGGRSLWVEPRDYQFGASALATRRASIEKEVARLDAELGRIVKEQAEVTRQLGDAQRAAQGHKAAQELLDKADAFAEARERLAGLQQARREAASRMSQLDAEHDRALTEANRSESAYEAAIGGLKHSEEQLAARQRDHAARRAELRETAQASRSARAAFPPSWAQRERIKSLVDEFATAQQAKIALNHLERELETGSWETDAQVIERHARMEVQVREQDLALSDRKASNEMARVASSNARERYIDVLRATLRRYRKNVQELGELAGVIAEAQLPHLDNDDTVLAQAGLHVRFNFDGKGEVGLNDGEASGGQQVLKSLILLVGLMKDDDAPGGFVFIDEPFAHLDVRNIQLVGHFLRSTRAQYLLTTPITHNVEVFEPSDITLVTGKKPRGERWAPPIAVLQRRPEKALYD
ncbi:MAG: AAA family ATPase [Paucibacter sp.]|nr:AAA family ATPase [Roseateles sp.]